MPAEERAGWQELNENIDHSGSAFDAPEKVQSAQVVPHMNGVTGQIPGFVVPLETNDDGLITEFFLVPYFGACIHLPPPPPNQIIFVKPDEPFELASLWQPYTLTGKLSIEQTDNAVAQSAYSMQASQVELYDYQNP